MQVVVTGAHGLIGHALAQRLRQRGASVTGVTRSPQRRHETGVTWVGWDGLADAVGSAQAVVHLAGAGLGDARWTERRKAELRSSRIETARQVVAASRDAAEPPEVLVSASAVGYYGSRGDAELTEQAAAGEGFLAELCRDWEAAAQGSNARTVVLRFGVVLSREGGALKRLLLPFRLGLGGPVGGGEQYLSWVHMDDAVSALVAALQQPAMEGIYNVTAPEPLRNRDFATALGRLLRRPARLPLPARALRLALGEGASVLTDSQRALPQRLQAAGFDFQHATLEGALRNLFP